MSKSIQILQLMDGAKKAKGLTVIIDVFRAFSLEAYLMNAGAKAIIPIGDKEIAYKLKRENRDMILAGERHGKILPGFDMGNSPSGASFVNVKDKIIVHTTSAGTQGIANATGTDEILGCGLVNAKATAEYIKRSGAKDISLVCMGLEALAPTEEDTLCAEYIRALLTENTIDMEREIENLKYTSGAKFFDKNQNDVFPEADFHMCTQLDKFNFILKYDKSGYIKKVDI